MEHDTKPETGSWLYSSLLQIVRPITNLTTKFGTLANLYTTGPSYQYSEEDNTRFTDIWKETDADVVFFSLHIVTQNDDESQIKQIGVSKWRSDSGTQILSLQAQVEDDNVVEKSSFPRLVVNDFMFGEAEVISESDIGAWLECTFRCLRGSQQPTYLVGYDISDVLRLVQPYWKVPGDIIIFDTRAILEFKQQARSHPSLKQTLGAIARGWDGSQLDNAGNCARFILELVDRHASRIKAQYDTKKYMHMGLNMWRSPSW